MFDELIEYLEQREDAEYFTDSPSPVPNEEMRMLIDLRMVKAQHEIMIDALKLATEYVRKSHHIDGCQKARENWKACTCMRDDLLVLLGENERYCGKYNK